MRFSPSHELHILPEEEFTSAMPRIEAMLDACRHSGHVASFDGLALFYEYFLAENSIGTIVVVHGLSEFTKKFYEIAWYFLHQGYNVVLYDQRGHGLSGRLTNSIPLIHVDRFEDYVEDLDTIIHKVVLPAVKDAPLFLFAHSMGGAVATLHMATHPDSPVQKTVLSSPLIAPRTGKVPFWLLRALAHLEARFAGKKAKSCQASEFDPHVCHTPRSPDLSAARFERNLALRRSTVYYQSTPQTAGWNSEVLDLRHILLSRKITDAIQTPTLLLSAGKDSIVRLREQHTFAKRCAACRLYTLENARHSLFTGSEPILAEMLTQTFTFLREPM